MNQVSAVDGERTSPSDFKARFGWAMYDWAAQPYFTIILTFIFGPYFVNYVAADAQSGQQLWANAQGVAGLAMAVTAPFLGAYADTAGPRKPWVVAFSMLCVITTATLWFAEPGADGLTIWLILGAFILSFIGAEYAIVFNNAMLPDLAGRTQIGRLSGFGWAMGYIGALLALPIVLWLTGQLPGVAGPELDAASHVGDRLSGPFVAVWFVVFMIPFMLFTPDAPATGVDRAEATRRTLSETWQTIKTLHHRPNLLRYLIARMCYYDGLNALFAFGGVYAALRFGWTTTELGIFGIIILLFGAPGCFLGGWLDDHIGSKNTLYLSVGGLCLTMLGILSIGDGHVMFVVEAGFPVPDDGLFAAPAELFMVTMAVALGVFAGPAQASSRSLIARIAPPDEIGKYFGLFALSGKATSFVAPLSVGALLGVVGDRWAYGVILVFLVLGLVLLIGVREESEA
ncbi:MAG: MFS transporter [Pseudomonadota bacterium]